MQDYAHALNEALQGEQAIVMVTVVAAGGAWHSQIGQQMLVHENDRVFGRIELPEAPSALTSQIVQAAQRAILAGKPHIEKIAGPANTWAEVFVEPFLPPPVLLIAGAGHIAAPLAAMAHLMNFSVSVTDDRASFANRERFPQAKQLLVGDIEATLRNYPITPRTHIVLVTRAHAHDVQGLRAIIDSPAAYIGMIGSRSRVQTVLRTLGAEGYDEKRLREIHAPIGLDIGSESPEEIALAIIAEVVAVRRGGTGTPLSKQIRPVAIEAGA